MASSVTELTASVEKGVLVIRLPLYPSPQPSATGKTMVVASSRGNVVTDLKVDGKNVVVGLTAYIKR